MNQVNDEEAKDQVDNESNSLVQPRLSSQSEDLDWASYHDP